MLSDSSAQRLASSSILVVDDDPAIRGLLGMALASEGAVVRMASDGQDALDHLRDSPRIDLIVLDLSMPVMDGRTFFRALRELPSDTPVLIVSAYGAESARQELGAEAAMDKPFDPFELADRIEALLAVTD